MDNGMIAGIAALVFFGGLTVAGLTVMDASTFAVILVVTSFAALAAAVAKRCGFRYPVAFIIGGATAMLGVDLGATLAVLFLVVAVGLVAGPRERKAIERRRP